ncbi:MAG: aminodeoxychorismate lyase, partial [Chthoniobacteraceae bacterium]
EFPPMTDCRVNGHAASAIDIRDRGFQYGDGVFTTIRVEDGAPLFLGRHFDRLRHDAERLGMAFVGSGVLLEDVRALLGNRRHGVLKIQLTRGMGGRGYRPPETVVPTRVVTFHPPAPYPAEYPSHGVEVRYCRTRLGGNPALAGIKHMNRLEQILARAEWSTGPVAEGLMLDFDGHIVEGIMSNVVLVRDGQLVTPLIDRCGVAGVMRSLIWEGAADLGLSVSEERVTPAGLEAADELFLTNSIIGIWPVRTLEHHHFPVGPVALELAAWLKNTTRDAINAWSAG